MPAKTLRGAMQNDAGMPAARRPALPTALLDRTCLALFALISVFYFTDAITISARSPVWMDEVLALWTARQRDLPAVWAALKKGSEFTPPLYDSFLHGWIELGAASPLMLRLPSIVAGYLAAIAMGTLARRHTGWALAALAAGATLAGPLFDYAVQLRPYIFVTAAFGWALVIWDGLTNDRPALPRLLGLGTLLTAMVALHFYALLLVLTLGLAELVRQAMAGRLPRIPVVATVMISAATILCWWPIIHAASQFSRGDVFAPAYYGRPMVSRLTDYYHCLFDQVGIIAIAPALVLLAGRRHAVRGVRLGVLALLLSAIPAFVFLFALVVSHSFAMRYVLAGTFGGVLALVWLVHQFRENGALWAAGILMLLTVLSHVHSGIEITRQDRLDLFALAMSAPATGDIPIATGDGLRYLEMMANLPPEVTRRIVYVDLPGFKASDPTNMHQVERWKAIDGTLRVVDAAQFLCHTPRFWLLTDVGSAGDDFPGWLKNHAVISSPRSDRQALTLVQGVRQSRFCNGF